MKKLVVMGQGYVGLPLSISAVRAGYDVLGYEVNYQRAHSLNGRVSYIEDITEAELKDALSTGRFAASTSVSELTGFDYAIITVPTPLREGVPDLSYIEEACQSIGPFIRPGSTVILESTTYPGTTEELVASILEQSSGLEAGVDFHLGYSPERIDPGNKEWTLINTPKVVSGINPASLKSVQDLYEDLVDQTVPVSGTKEAELTKLLENTFRHVNIALVNELAMFSHDLGINIWEAIDAASTKPFGYMRFTPGPGVGGHCLPIDPSYLAWSVERSLGQRFRFVELANDVNEHMPQYVVGRVTGLLNDHSRSVRGSRVLILGLAYKKNTGDARESPSTSVVELLVKLGADVRVADPHVASSSIDHLVSRVTANPQEFGDADLILVLVDHDEFDMAAVTASESIVLDTRAVTTTGTANVL